MAPALARRTPQKTFDEGRPKRQAALNRKETPGASKKKGQASTEKNPTRQEKRKVLPKKQEAKAKKKPVATKSKKPTKTKKETNNLAKSINTSKATSSKSSDTDNGNDNKRKSSRKNKNDEGNTEEEEVVEENANEVKLDDGDEKNNTTEDSQAEDETEESEADDGEENSDDTDFDPDDDPEKLWCFCKKTHGNRFMICCDSCEEWFHGDCVGITMMKGREMEKTGEEWCCDKCKAKLATKESNETILRSPLNSPLKKVDQGNSLKKTDQHSSLKKSEDSDLLKKSDHSDPLKKSEHKPIDPSRLTKARSLSLDSMKSNLAKSLKDRTLSTDIISKKITTSLSTDEKKTEQMTEESPEKVRTDNVKLVLEKIKHRQREPVELTDIIKFDHVPAATISSKKDRKRSSERCVSFNNDDHDDVKRRKKEEPKSKVRTTPTPNKFKNLEAPKLCVREDCKKNAMKGAIYCNRECIYKYANESMKFIEEEKKKNMAALKSPDYKHESLKTMSQGTTVISPATSSTDRVSEITQERIAVFEKSSGKVVAGVMAPTKKYLFAWLEEHPSYEVLKPGKQMSDLKNQKKDHDETVRSNVRKSLKDIFISRCKEVEMAINIEAVGKICRKVESELLKLFGETGQKYKTKYRSLIFNLKDQQNKVLYKRVVSGEISPRKLVNMTPEQLATPELARWREHETKHQIEMVKKREQEDAEILKQPGLKKTHKGEVEIDVDNENIETSEVNVKAPEPIEEHHSSSVSSEIMNLLNDTTEEHNHHLFDSNCKICTGKIAPPGESQLTGISTTVIQAVPESSVPSPGDDDVLLSSPPSPDTSLTSPLSPVPPPPPSARKQPSVWRGFVMMQKVSKFVTTAYAVSGSCEDLMEILPDTIHVCGRIPPTQVWDYINQLKSGRKNQSKYIDVIRFEMSTDEEKSGYIKLYTYFYTRQRIGVVGNCYSGVKDMYILPLASHDPIPHELKPLPGLPKPRPHMLLGIIVRIKSSKKSKFIEFMSVVDSSPEMVLKKKRRKKEKKKEKDIEKDKIQQAQKKLVDIIFKSRTTPLPEVEQDTSLSVLQAITDTIPKPKEEVVDLDPVTDQAHKQLEKEQLQTLKEQQEEIYRLQQQVGTESSNSDSEIVIIPDPESIVKDIEDSVFKINSESVEKSENMVAEENIKAIQDEEDLGDSETKVEELIPLLSSASPTSNVDFKSSNDLSSEPETIMHTISCLNEEEQHHDLPKKQQHDSPKDGKKEPSDDDYVMTLIEDIKIPTPKFPLDIIKSRSGSKMPELPIIQIPGFSAPTSSLQQIIATVPPPVPGVIPKVPIHPNIKLPPGVPFPPLPPHIPASTAVQRDMEETVTDIRTKWKEHTHPVSPLTPETFKPIHSEQDRHTLAQSYYPPVVSQNTPGDPRRYDNRHVARESQHRESRQFPPSKRFSNQLESDRHEEELHGQRMGHIEEFQQQSSYNEQTFSSCDNVTRSFASSEQQNQPSQYPGPLPKAPVFHHHGPTVQHGQPAPAHHSPPTYGPQERQAPPSHYVSPVHHGPPLHHGQQELHCPPEQLLFDRGVTGNRFPLQQQRFQPPNMTFPPTVDSLRELNQHMLQNPYNIQENVPMPFTSSVKQSQPGPRAHFPPGTPQFRGPFQEPPGYLHGPPPHRPPQEMDKPPSLLDGIVGFDSYRDDTENLSWRNRNDRDNANKGVWDQVHRSRVDSDNRNRRFNDRDHFRKDNFRRDGFRRDEYRRDDFRRNEFQRDEYQRDDFRKDGFEKILDRSNRYRDSDYRRRNDNYIENRSRYDMGHPPRRSIERQSKEIYKYNTEPIDDLEEGEVIDCDNSVKTNKDNNTDRPSSSCIPETARDRGPPNVSDEQDMWQQKGQYKPWGNNS